VQLSFVNLSFGEPQTAVAIAFAVIAGALAVFFAIAALQTRRDVPAERVRQVAYRLRPAWLGFLVLLLTGAVGISLFLLPYSGAAGAARSVEVTGGQFYWSVSPERVPADCPIDFEVTSADVNHGFGVYDPAGVLLGSVQAMPGYTNRLELTLDEPGSYQIACLEFCGVKHHEMVRELEVAAGPCCPQGTDCP
jgi:cytochrome c oxidase subunit 2